MIVMIDLNEYERLIEQEKALDDFRECITTLQQERDIYYDKYMRLKELVLNNLESILEKESV